MDKYGEISAEAVNSEPHFPVCKLFTSVTYLQIFESVQIFIYFLLFINV